MYLELSGAYAREFYVQAFYNSTCTAFNTQQIKLLNSNKSHQIGKNRQKKQNTKLNTYTNFWCAKKYLY